MYLLFIFIFKFYVIVNWNNLLIEKYIFWVKDKENIFMELFLFFKKVLEYLVYIFLNIMW